MAAALNRNNRFIRQFQWTPECNQAFLELKQYRGLAPFLVTPKESEDLYLYLDVSEYAMNSALVGHSGAWKEPMYFSSKTLFPAQTRYLPLEKLGLASMSVARKLLPYFQAHTIVVLTEHPLKNLF